MSRRKATRRTPGGGRRGKQAHGEAEAEAEGEGGAGRGTRHPRAIWQGAVSFGLVHIPVHLHTASRDSSVDLDLLDRRDFSRVGYQRYNKRTGKTVAWDQIVKGYEYRKGAYVALTDEDFRRANVKASRTIDIVRFTDLASIPPEYFERPYYLEPAEGGAKTYALLREAMRGDAASTKVAIGSFVMRGRQHLCALLAQGRSLMLNTLRFAEEIVEARGLDIPAAGLRNVKVTRAELAMARKLVDELSGAFEPDEFRDTYRRDLMRRIKEKVRKRQTHLLTPVEETGEERPSAEIIDLTEVLRRSLEAGGRPRRRGKAA